MKKKVVEKKTVVRIVKAKSGFYETVKGKERLPLLGYQDALKQGCGMTRKSAAFVVETLCRDAPSKGITALVVFFEDPIAIHNEYYKTLVKKKGAKKK